MTPLGRANGVARTCTARVRPPTAPTAAAAWAAAATRLQGRARPAASITTTTRRSAQPDNQADANRLAWERERRERARDCPLRPSQVADLYPSLDTFPRRHIGPDAKSVDKMLAALDPSVSTMDDFIMQVIPGDILDKRLLKLEPTGQILPPMPEHEVLQRGKRVAELNRHQVKSFIGKGYYGVRVPEVIKRNVLENPAWYTSYTPYQAEISQGRLESLLNFQTLVCDLTGLPVANASLLDEGTAAAEAMTLSINSLPASRTQRPGRTYIVSDRVHAQTVAVLKSRAEGFGIQVKVMSLFDQHGNADLAALDSMGEDVVGVLVQYPDTFGQLFDWQPLADQVHKQGALLACATDLLALTLIKPPGEWGADIAFGNSQRLGVPMGYGGPHAAFFAVQDKYKRKIPGRLVGVSKDRLGNRALRLALQTREQHIRREKATSNVCTAQALLANMSAFYAIYHGPEGLRQIAQRIRTGAEAVKLLAENAGYATMEMPSGQAVHWDTVIVSCPGKAALIQSRAKQHKMQFRAFSDNDRLGITVDEATTFTDLITMAQVLRTGRPPVETKGPGSVAADWHDADHNNPFFDRVSKSVHEAKTTTGRPGSLPQAFRRTSSYLTHPVFNSYHSETELLRYIHHLQSKDLSLVHSMIPLGSCTMKLNGSTEMALITEPGFANLHPLADPTHSFGYERLVLTLQTQLSRITGMSHTSLQPNSGAQGEFAGLRAIRAYHKSRGDAGRDICLIPVSAHGTNPASAAMAGMRVVPVKCDVRTGNLDVEDLRRQCEQHSAQIGAIMVTYPSTFGVFEPQIRDVCDIVHQHGGQVYMDGANMNAQIGLCSPGRIGADVCHLNLHKTFCIPHGGGGPGVGPICVKQHLAAFLPPFTTLRKLSAAEAGDALGIVSSAPNGSASILPISWAYNTLMGAKGLRHATEVAILNANYLLSRLRRHYPILYTNEYGRCAHEFILDTRPFSTSAGIDAVDVAKRLQDYGFHAPTMSWPVANTLMIEPTESESKEELDRFIDALVAIRGEIREIEQGRAPRAGNVLKMAPHPLADLVDGDDGQGGWTRPYSRQKAAYPLPWLRQKKFWPSVARINDTYGDMNLFCTCPPVQDTTKGEVLSSSMPDHVQRPGATKPEATDTRPTDPTPAATGQSVAMSLV